MPRTIEVSVASEKTGTLLARLEGTDGVAGLTVQRGASIQPPGDVVTIQATNGGTRGVLDLLDDLDVQSGGSVQTSEPRSLISESHRNGLDRESNETIWEEMAFLLRRDTNVSANYLALMACAGGIAAAGLWTNTLHIVIGAMVIAPGFEPLLRLPFGLVAGPRVLASRGAASTAAGYLALMLGGALALVTLRALDPGGSAELEARSWIRYWSQVTASGALVALIAGTAGALTVTAQRSVLSAGVMIALALIPSLTITAMALVSGDLPLAARSLIRWLVDVAAVVLSGAVVLGLKQATVHRRKALS